MEPVIKPTQNIGAPQPKRNKVPKKLLLIITSAVIVVIIAVGIVVALSAYLKPSAPVSKTSVSAADVFPDLSKNYGACSLLSKDQIKSALGEIADDVQNPVNDGIVGVALIGIKLSDFSADTQSCLYHFGSVSKAAIYTNDNGLTVQVTKFGNPESTAAYQKQITVNPSTTAVSGVGDTAFYTAQNTAGELQAYYTLQVFKGNALYEYALHLPANTSLDSSAAQKALVSLAQD